MKAALILFVGKDALIMDARTSPLRAAGRTVVSAFSIKKAAERFLGCDFDLILLDNSLPAIDADRITCLIRASGSLAPVVSIASERDYKNQFADMTVGSDLVSLRIGVRNGLAKSAKLPAAFAPSLKS
jgi:CheY-like chemotaxis protein